jgi:hypothetical protein
MIPTTIVPPGSTHDMKPTETLSPAVYYFFWREEHDMGRKYTPEQEIANLRSKRKITHREAGQRLRALAREEKAEAAKADRSLFRRVLDFVTRK